MIWWCWIMNDDYVDDDDIDDGVFEWMNGNDDMNE